MPRSHYTNSWALAGCKCFSELTGFMDFLCKCSFKQINPFVPSWFIHWQMRPIVTFLWSVKIQHLCWFNALTSKCVLGPYMSQIFRLRMSIPFPGCCKTRACDCSRQQNQWLISPCTSRLLCIITFQRLSVNACGGLWRVWISNLAYN